jgi:hypothetical protein
MFKEAIYRVKFPALRASPTVSGGLWNNLGSEFKRCSAHGRDSPPFPTIACQALKELEAVS